MERTHREKFQMSLNPIQYTESVVHNFLRYQTTAYPFSDPELDTQMRRLLSMEKPWESPLLQGPYVSLSRSFSTGARVMDLVRDGIFHPHMRERIPHKIDRVYGHQEKAIRAVHGGRPTLVSTGTGSGKSECFLYPIISKCFQLRDEGASAGISAVIVYPMNALAEDQLQRLRELLAGTGISFGMYVGKTPDKEKDVSHVRLPQGSSQADYLAKLDEFRRDGRDGTVVPPEEKCSRQAMREPGGQPRILLTNVKQLELLLTRQTDVELFQDARLDYLVFDEAHTFTGAQGAETACLIRRLRAYVGANSDKTVCIATSATIADRDNPDAARQFAERFFGVEASRVEVVGESYEADAWAEVARRWKPAPIKEPVKALAEIAAAVSEGEGTIRSVYLSRVGRKLSEGMLEEVLHAELSACSVLVDLADILVRPCLLAQAATELGTRQGREVGPEELLFWLTLGAEARSEGRALVRPVVHGFLRGIGGAGVSWPGAASKAVLHLSAEDDPAIVSKDLARFPISTCTTCGQHYYHTWLADFHFTEQDKVPSGGKASGDSSYWEHLDEASGGNRVVLVDRLVGDDDHGAGNGKCSALHFCRHCGAAHRKPEDRCLHCGRGGGLVALQTIQTKAEFPGHLSSCLTCHSPGRSMGSRYREPCRPVRAVHVADVHVLAQDMLHAAERKRLLVFCDNRQDAAFQAGWMQDHARRYRLRALIHNEVKQGGISISDLVFRLDERLSTDKPLSRALLPEVWRHAPEEEATSHEHARLRKKFLRIQILREITMGWRQRTGLEPWGRIKIQYHGLNPQDLFIVEKANQLRMPSEELCDGIASVLDHLRRAQILHDREEPIYGHIWMDGEPEVQHGYLPAEIRPSATKLMTVNENEKKWLTGWISHGHLTGLRAIVQKWGVGTDNADAFLTDLYEYLVTQGLLVPVQLRGSKNRILPGGGDCHQISSGKLVLHPNKGRFVCRKCQRPAMRKTPHMRCLGWHCDGTLEWRSEEPDNYDLKVLDQGLASILPEEHTAMVPHAKRERIENLFKGDADTVNCLVCTQTLEMGVDIGSLDATLLRNVPPLPANYWQRVGRAGRRHRMAVNFTYCRGMSHDRAYFREPLRLLDGKIDPPSFHLGNPLMVAKHVHASVLTELHKLVRKESIQAPEQARIREEIGKAFPARVTNYLFDSGRIRTEAYDLSGLKNLLHEYHGTLLDAVSSIFEHGWPEKDREIVSRVRLEAILLAMPASLESVLKRLRRRVRWATEQLDRIAKQGAIHGNPTPEDTALRRRCENYLKKLKGDFKNSRSEAQGYDDVITYGVLAAEGFLPGYGLESGSIVGTAEVPWWAVDSRELVLPRPPGVALREYVPGNLIYSNGQKFVPRRFELGAEESRAETPVFEVDLGRQAVRQTLSTAPTGALGSQELVALAMTDVQLIHISQISDEEDNRFQMSVGVFGVERGQHEGGQAWTWGKDPVQLRKATRFRMVNVGAKSELEKNQNLGYPVCSVCGASVSPFSSTLQQSDFAEKHLAWCGKAPTRIGFFADVIADSLFLNDCTDRTEAYSLLEGLRMAASDLLEMHIEDLQILVIGKMGTDQVDGVLWDPMPGGSGLLQQITERWPEIVDRMRELAETCAGACDKSCPDCLQTYRNAFYHEHLDRTRLTDALDLRGRSLELSHAIPAVLPAETPQGESVPVNSAERKLRRLLLKAGFPEFQWQQKVLLKGKGFTIPDAIYTDEEEDLRIAIYEDGMSARLHGNDATAARDSFLREALRQEHWEVFEITAHDLDDPIAISRTFKRLGRLLGNLEQVKMVLEQRNWYASGDSTLSGSVLEVAESEPLLMAAEESGFGAT